MSSNYSAIEKALECLGRGFDVTSDFRLKYCKGNERIVCIKGEKTELSLPGFGTFKDVPVEVKFDKGDRIRLRTDVLEFNQMSELFNQKGNLAGKIPSGLFNAVFDFDGGSWGPDAAMTKCLAMDGYFISLFNLHLECRPLRLAPHVIDAVPATWDPSAVTSFIENYGTHVVVGLSMGGQDVVYVKQNKSSQLPLCEIKYNLDKLGDQLFTGICTLPLQQRKSKENKSKVSGAFNVFDTQPSMEGLPPVSYKEGITVIYSKRGGDPSVSNHCEWVLTVPTHTDAINFTFVPITSLLKGIPGTGFLSHAINLYLRYKPPLSELKYFLDFQHQKIWAPTQNDHPLGPSSNRVAESPALYFSPMSPKLHVSRNQWKKFARACTMPVKYDPSWSTDAEETAFIVTGVQLHVQTYGFTSVLHLRLLYTEVQGYTISQSKWARSPSHFSGKSSFLSMSFTGSSSGLDREKNGNQIPHVDSGVFNMNPPAPVGTLKLLKFVDTCQITMGPQDSPGHWLVTGAKLDVEKGKIMLHVKFSLLAPVS
ncbi:MACPF domain-containing protein [Carex littledalei]|uniref:MACPF domain-containing protein n=1 Tax=Carex littledalei TaxID=544730 RepID=A0A833R274_9POAL|nr:MACPF domain-containing protein [Carex littledalei]